MILQGDIECLQSLDSVRAESYAVYDAVKQGLSEHFTLDETRLSTIAEAIDQLITGGNQILPHGRWRHIPTCLLPAFGGPRALVDMLTVSVLLDAGAGDDWMYEWEGGRIGRSEGIAIAVAIAFHRGQFQSDKKSAANAVDGTSLAEMNIDDLKAVFQVTDTNQIAGLAGRLSVINRLGRTLLSNKVFSSTHRPSAIMDYISGQHPLDVKWFWKHVIMEGFGDVWPEDRKYDMHFCSLTRRTVPFHKLSQWLCYSLLEPIERLFHFRIVNDAALTGLAEYRNGGLFIDYGAIQLRDPDSVNTVYAGGDEIVVEWRALTIVLLDKLKASHFPSLTLAQLLEAGTWKAGRLIARHKRPSGAPPLRIHSDGTLF